MSGGLGGCARTHDANPLSGLSEKIGDLCDCAGAGGVLVGEAFGEFAAVAVTLCLEDEQVARVDAAIAADAMEHDFAFIEELV